MGTQMIEYTKAKRDEYNEQYIAQTEMDAWVTFASAILSCPSNETIGASAELADDMIVEFRKRFVEEEKKDG